MKAAVHLLCGKVCSGKSHYAKSLAAELGAITLSMDELMLSLFDERLGANHDLVAARSKAYLFRLAARLSALGLPVVLDFGLWTRADRQEARDYFACLSIPTKLYYLYADEAVRKARVLQRNQQVRQGLDQSYTIDEDMDLAFSARFEPPAPEENALLVRTD